MSDTPTPDDAIPGRGSIVSLGAEIDALRACLAQAEQERDAAEAARDEVFAVIERQHVQSSDQQVNEELHAARDEVVALRTALETINVGTNDKWVLAIARAALGSTNEPEEPRGEADDVGRRPPTTIPNPSHMEERGGRPWDIFKRRAEPEEVEK